MITFLSRPTLEDLCQDHVQLHQEMPAGLGHQRQNSRPQGRKELFYPYGKTYAQTIGEQD